MKKSTLATAEHTIVARTEQQLRRAADWLAAVVERRRSLFLLLATALYFGDTLYRASRRLFWYDELYTVYLARLPSMARVWQALTHGADFLGILFHSLTHASSQLLGEAPVALRLPSIFGFWIFSLCLFRMVRLRSSAVPAFISLLVPMLTVTYWYASEARAYGVALGFCGLALVCWQAATDEGRSHRTWWLTGLGVSLVCVLLTHAYAFLVFVPLAAGELWRDTERRKVDWAVWVVFALASTAELASLPLLHAVKAENGVVPQTMRLLVPSYQFFLRPPGGAVLLAWLTVLALLGSRTAWIGPQQPPRGRRLHEAVALGMFLALPLVTCVTGKLVHAQVFPRYGVYAVAGLAALVGLSVARRPVAAAGTLLVLLVATGIDFAHFRSESGVLEPGWEHRIVSTTHQRFDERYAWIRAQPDQTLPVMLGREFLETAYYAPPELVPRLAFVIWPDQAGAVAGRAYEALRNCCQAIPNAYPLAQFRAEHSRYLVFGYLEDLDRLEDLIALGDTVTVLRTSTDYYLAGVSRAGTGHAGTTQN